MFNPDFSEYHKHRNNGSKRNTYVGYEVTDEGNFSLVN